MQYGYFDDQQREYVITTPRTPLPWINYLGSEDFFTLLSNTAGGYSFYRDARLRRLTRYRYNNSPLDSEGFRIYLRDGDTVWNPGCQPSGADLDSYCCRHGLGYTVLEGSKKGVIELAVPVANIGTWYGMTYSPLTVASGLTTSELERVLYFGRHLVDGKLYTEQEFMEGPAKQAAGTVTMGAAALKDYIDKTGKVDFSYNGTLKKAGKIYYFKNGKLTKTK
jgi:hypothetical protein